MFRISSARRLALAACVALAWPLPAAVAAAPQSPVALAAPSSAAHSPAAPTLTARAWLLLDATSGQVLGAQNASARIEPASLTKIMTAYVVFQALAAKEITLEQQVTISTRAWKVAPGSSRMFLEPNKQVSIDALLYGLMVQSGNDAAVALAEAVSGSVEAFVARMNQQAQAMGLAGTHFNSPSGLPDAQTYSTAADLGTLAARMSRDFGQTARRYDTTREYTYNNIRQPNRNRLLWADPSVDGMKTGHTESAGYCLIGSASRAEGGLQRRLIAVVIGTDSDKTRTQEARTLLEWGYGAFRTVRLYQAGEAAGEQQVWKGQADVVPVGYAQDFYLTTPAGARIERSVQPVATLVAPVTAQQQVGVVQITVDGKPAMQVPLVAKQPVPEAGIAGRAWDSMRLWWRDTVG
ncbi:peptidase [Bordetella genomosp. 1]|uniref:serine-type D-Ala-D-Ala carboxypeptidase n=1 Tax=Bordetella genomosp. 1 TaxID=1395607 RepID=A0A261RVY2_9BORD|nr:D-alanyl-D-alanine carboxypeptidase family protein [Bordetella genomosp. 1]OZI29214.1 peptidase [Bordetella genomosp. 1]